MAPKGKDPPSSQRARGLCSMWLGRGLADARASRD